MKLVDLIESKRSAVRFSWHGNCDCFEKFGGPVIDAICKETVTWTHEKNYPVNLKFQLKFVKFDEALVLGSGVPPCCSQIAFVHVYFFNAATVEEYRAALPEFAEWYSKSKHGQWLVVFDSARSREQKSRTQVLEKIKSDVSGSQNRIFELNGMSDMKAFGILISALVTNYTTSLDTYSAAIKSMTITLSEDCDIPGLINNQFNLCFFYWSLGMTENALTEMENLDSAVTKIFAETASSLDGKVCTVLNTLKSIDGRGESPFLETQLKRNSVEHGDSLISLRAFILGHQFLAGAFSFETRKLSGDALTLNSLNNYFASALFTNTYNLLIWIKQNIFPNSIYDQVYQNCLQVIWTREAFAFSECYGNYLRLEATTEQTAKLCMLNAEACLFLRTQDLSSYEWLSAWKKVSNNSILETLMRSTDIQRSNFIEHCNRSLNSAIQTLKSAKWIRNFVIFRLQLTKIMIESGKKEELYSAIDEILSFSTKLPISFVYLQLKQCIGEPTEILKSNPELLSKFNSYLCNIILSSKEPTTANNKQTAFKLYNFDVGNDGKNRFPFRLNSIHPTFISVQMNKSFQMAVNLHSDHEIPLSNCSIKAVFKPLNPKNVYFNAPSFESIMQDNNQCRLQCVNDGMDKKRIESKIALPKLYAEDAKDLTCKFVGEQETLTVGANQLEFVNTPEITGNFALSHLSIIHSSGFEFIVSVEHEKLNSKIVGCFCFVSTKMASVKLAPKDAKKTLYAGIAQELELSLHAGSMSVPKQTTLKARFLDLECVAEFLLEDEKWSNEFECQLPEIEAMSEYSLTLCFCTNIHQMNYSSKERFSFPRNLEIEWQDKTWTFQLQFTSILSIKTMTSILEDKTLFETDIQNCYGNDQLLIVPLEACMASVDDENENLIPADLLNDCLEPIYADSTYRLIWKLVKLKSTAPTNHNLRIRYKIQPNDDFGDKKSLSEMQKVICSREYLFKDTISFAISPVEFEICARILSEKPQNVICRAEKTCDFVISLRMLTKNKAETVVVALEADPEHWTLIDKFKVVQIKENGLGQTTFSLMPRAGFLVYPSVYIHRFNSGDSTSERDLTNLNESKLFGERITAFNRSEAKQIHVLGAYNAEDTDSVHSTTSGIKSLRVQAKERLQRFFES